MKFIYLPILLSLLLVGVAEAREPTREGTPVNGSAPDINYGIVKPMSPKKVVIPYDDFLKIIASKEHSDKLKSQCAAERAILLKLNDENGTIKKLSGEQLQAVIEENETRKKIGETQEQINEALERQLAAKTQDLEVEKSQKYWWAGGWFTAGVLTATIIILALN